MGIGRRATFMTVCGEGIRQIFADNVAIVIHTGHFFLVPAIFKRCVTFNMKITRTSVSHGHSIALTSITTLSSVSISAYLCLGTPVRSEQFIIGAFWWGIDDKVMLRGINEMLGVDWLPHQPCDCLDDVSTPVIDRVLVIAISSHILESVQCPLPKSLIIWHASHELLDIIPVFEPWDTQSSVFYLQQSVVVCLHTVLLDPRRGKFLLFPRRKRVVGSVM